MKTCSICGITDMHRDLPYILKHGCIGGGQHIWIETTREEIFRIPEFIEMLESMKKIHIKKNTDYASESNPFSNFERSGTIASWFTNSVDRSFAILIGTKLARLAELLEPGRIANNESVEDSFLDMATYCILWASYKKRKQDGL